MIRKIGKRLAAVLASAVLGAMMMPSAAFAQDPVSLSIPVEVKVSGSSIPAGTEYKLVIEGLDNAPMPESTVITIKDAGTAFFGPILYTVPDDYQYRIYQDSEKKENFTYDSGVYTVTVQVVNGEDGKLAANIVAGKEGVSEKAEGMIFNNAYTAPGGTGGNTGGGGGSSSGGGGGGDGGRTDLTTPDVTTITDEGTPTAQIGEDEVPLSDGGIIDQILDNLVPLAVLPKTGDSSLTYGALLAVLLISGSLAGGMYWKRRKNGDAAQ